MYEEKLNMPRQSNIKRNTTNRKRYERSSRRSKKDRKPRRQL